MIASPVSRVKTSHTKRRVAAWWTRSPTRAKRRSRSRDQWPPPSALDPSSWTRTATDVRSTSISTTALPRSSDPAPPPPPAAEGSTKSSKSRSFPTMTSEEVTRSRYVSPTKSVSCGGTRASPLRSVWPLAMSCSRPVPR